MDAVERVDCICCVLQVNIVLLVVFAVERVDYLLCITGEHRVAGRVRGREWIAVES